MQCSTCRIRLEPGTKFCYGCGNPVAPVAPPQAQNKCSCGTAIAPGNKFCEHCGKPVASAAIAPPQVVQSKNCSGCGGALAPGNKFCESCGKAVAPAAAAAPLPPTYGSSHPSAPPPPAGDGRKYAAYIPQHAPLGVIRAVEHAECPICFDAMCSQPSGVLTKSGRRCCVHFFHKRCITDVLNAHPCNATCPMCRLAFDSVLEVPSIEKDPKRWFQCVDLNGDHKLSRQEVTEVFRAQLPCDMEQLEEQMPQLFRRFDHDGDGYITEQEIMAPGVGLLAYIMQNYPRGNLQIAIPDIRRDKQAWFRFFDEDKSGTLEKEEVVRALVKSFRMSEDLQRVHMMREIVNAIWPIFDHDGSGTIEMHEFSLPRDGLADSVIASMG